MLTHPVLLLGIFCYIIRAAAVPEDFGLQVGVVTLPEPSTEISTSQVTNVNTYTVVSSTVVSETSTYQTEQSITTVITKPVTSTVLSTSTEIQVNVTSSTNVKIEVSTSFVLSTVTTNTQYITTENIIYVAEQDVLYTYPTSQTTDVYSYFESTVVSLSTSYTKYTVPYVTSWYTYVASPITVSGKVSYTSVFSLAVSTDPTSVVVITDSNVWQYYFYPTVTSTYVSTMTEEVSTSNGVGTFTYPAVYTVTHPVTSTTTVDTSLVEWTDVETTVSTQTFTSIIPTSVVEYSDEYSTSVYNTTFAIESVGNSTVFETSTSTTSEVSIAIITNIVEANTVTYTSDGSLVSTQLRVVPISDSKSSSAWSGGSVIPSTVNEITVESSSSTSSISSAVNWNSTEKGAINNEVRSSESVSVPSEALVTSQSIEISTIPNTENSKDHVASNSTTETVPDSLTSQVTTTVDVTSRITVTSSVICDTTTIGGQSPPVSADSSSIPLDNQKTETLIAQLQWTTHLTITVGNSVQPATATPSQENLDAAAESQIESVPSANYVPGHAPLLTVSIGPAGPTSASSPFLNLATRLTCGTVIYSILCMFILL